MVTASEHGPARLWTDHAGQNNHCGPGSESVPGPGPAPRPRTQSRSLRLGPGLTEPASEPERRGPVRARALPVTVAAIIIKTVTRSESQLEVKVTGTPVTPGPANQAASVPIIWKTIPVHKPPILCHIPWI